MTESRWKHPSELMAISGGYWESFAIHAAVELGIFDVVGSKCLTVEVIAGTIGADPVRLEHLLNTLAAMELLVKRDHAYENTTISSERLCRGSDKTLVDILLHHKNLVESWSQLAQRIAPTVDLDESVERANFLLGMRNMGNLNAPVVLKHIDLSGCVRMLDLGSGPGAYALQFCKAYPTLDATLFDRPTTQSFVDALIAENDMSERMRFVEGDFTCDSLGNGYDVVWASHVLHSNSPRIVEDILKRVHHALEPGGRVIVQEFILNQACDGPLFPALFSLNMMVNDNGGKSFSVGELEEMLLAAGFEDVTVVSLPGPADIMIGTKRGDC